MHELPLSERITDQLFLERLDAFLQKSLADIIAFAQRESITYEEV
jgi:hypothetical protein